MCQFLGQIKATRIVVRVGSCSDSWVQQVLALMQCIKAGSDQTPPAWSSIIELIFLEPDGASHKPASGRLIDPLNRFRAPADDQSYAKINEDEQSFVLGTQDSCYKQQCLLTYEWKAVQIIKDLCAQTRLNIVFASFADLLLREDRLQNLRLTDTASRIFISRLKLHGD